MNLLLGRGGGVRKISPQAIWLTAHNFYGHVNEYSDDKQIWQSDRRQQFVNKKLQ